MSRTYQARTCTYGSPVLDEKCVTLEDEGARLQQSVSASPPGDPRQSFCRRSDGSNTRFFRIELRPTIHFYGTVLTGTFLKVIQVR